MNKLFLALCLIAGAAMAQTNVTTNTVVSNARTVKAWRRTYVMGVEGGRLLDASGTIADKERGLSMQASAGYASNLTAAAYTGISNALGRLYAVTGQVSRFSDRIYVAGDLEPSELGASNFWWYVAAEGYEGVSTNLYWVWFSRRPAYPPKLQFHYRTEGAGSLVTADCVQWNSLVDTNGFAGCVEYRAIRPSFAQGITMRLNPFGRLGAPGGSLDLSQAGLAIVQGGVTNIPFTGTYTNTAGQVKRFQSGLLLFTTNLYDEALQ